MTLEPASLSELCALSLMWRGKDLPPSGWRRLLKRERWMQHLSGRICEPSRAASFVEQWTASLAATRARERARLDSGAARMIRVGSGPGSPESCATPAPPGASSKTSPITRISAFASSARSWKAWVSKLRQESLARRRSALLTGESGSSSSPCAVMWPTATTMDCKASGAAAYSTESGRHTGTTLTDAAVRTPQWLTPHGMVGTDHTGHVGAGGELDQQTKRVMAKLDAALTRQWSTPRASDGEKGGPNMAFGAGGTPLPAQATAWRTPTAGDIKTMRHHGNMGLAGQATDSLSFPQDHPMSMGGPESSSADASTSSRLYLNPLFVNWLMGWPDGWTNSAPAEMESYLFRQRMRLSALLRRSTPASPADRAAAQLSMFA